MGKPEDFYPQMFRPAKTHRQVSKDTNYNPADRVGRQHGRVIDFMEAKRQLQSLNQIK